MEQIWYRYRSGQNFDQFRKILAFVDSTFKNEDIDVMGILANFKVQNSVLSF